jgi:hypothetical protein
VVCSEVGPGTHSARCALRASLFSMSAFWPRSAAPDEASHRELGFYACGEISRRLAEMPTSRLQGGVLTSGSRRLECADKLAKPAS